MASELKHQSGWSAAAPASRLGNRRPGGNRTLGLSTVEFRCERCGKLLGAQAQDGQFVKCPHCRNKVAIPHGLASLPRPQIPGTQPPPDIFQEEPAQEPPSARP